MDFGVGLPTSGSLASPANIARVAQEAERQGYTAVWTYERLLRPVEPVAQGGGAPQPLPKTYRLVYDPLETLSYVAALTTRIRLGTSVIDALFHPPVVLARRFATLDQLSGGRVIAGLGQGWMPHEFDAAGVPMSRRGAGMEEMVAALRACWGPDPVEFTGRFYRIQRSEIGPKPVQAHLPVLLGTSSPAAIRRAARIADGINPIAASFDAVKGAVATFRDAAAEAGRDPDALTVVVRANVPLTAKPLPEDNRTYLGGSPDQIAQEVAELSQLHIDHIIFSPILVRDLDELVAVLGMLHATLTQARR